MASIPVTSRVCTRHFKELYILEADLSINNSVILDDMNEYINKHHDKSRAKKFYIFFHNCWDEKLLMADDKMMSVVARWELIKFFLLIRHENCVENCWVSYIGCQLNGRYLFLSASLWRGIHESKGRHSIAVDTWRFVWWGHHLLILEMNGMCGWKWKDNNIDNDMVLHKSSIARLPGFALYAEGLWHPVHAVFRMQLGVWLFARFWTSHTFESV